MHLVVFAMLVYIMITNNDTHVQIVLAGFILQYRELLLMRPVENVQSIHGRLKEVLLVRYVLTIQYQREGAQNCGTVNVILVMWAKMVSSANSVHQVNTIARLGVMNAKNAPLENTQNF
jgi:hypothetical protein